MGNGVDFFKFAGNEESRNSDELELSSEDTFLLEIPIDKVDGDEEGFWEEFEFQVDVDEPVDQDSSHFFIDISLDGFKVSSLG